MRDKRRDFLKYGALAGAAATTAACSSMGMDHGPATAAAARKRTAGGPMPKGMTFVTLARDGEYSLGVKTSRGILDVAHATVHYGSSAPTTIDDLIKYGDGGLTDLVRKAEGEGHGPLYLQESQVRYGPSVTNPQKIVCVGLNYAKHARETNNPIPKLPILFNKFNN